MSQNAVFCQLTSVSDGTPFDCSNESEDNDGMIEGGSSRANFSPTEGK